MPRRGGGSRKYKPRIIPEQDRRICGSICLCQLTVVASCVALVYLTVVVYLPSHRVFRSKIDPVPVMCHTVETIMMMNNCPWASCGEWCLTKTTGFCPQIYVTVRGNGTDIIFENCTNINNVDCPQVDEASLPRFNCNNGSECGSLTGFYSCKNGHCTGMSKTHQCTYKADGLVVDSERENVKLTGYFLCNKGRCIKARNVECVRYCPRIDTLHASVMVRKDDSVRAARCRRAVALLPNGTEQQFWEDTSGDVLFVSCTHLSPSDTRFRGSDCINGTLVQEDVLPQPSMNFSELWQLSNGPRLADPDQIVAPSQENITIFNRSRLYINLEACVNTLQGECKAFEKSHGRDGRNSTAPSRFPCYYDRNNSFFVVARFDLQKTRRELMIGVVVPGSLFVMSAATLCAMTRSVRVGDDARMRCTCCNGEHGEPSRVATSAPADDEEEAEDNVDDDDDDEDEEEVAARQGGMV